MLPDWPQSKDKIAEAFILFVRIESERRLGVFAEIKQTVVHEGNGTVICRADGSQADQGFTQVGAQMEIPAGLFAGMPIQEILQRLCCVAEEMARGRAEHTLSVLEAGVREAGNVVDGGGGPLTPDLILKTWEMMEIAFDEHSRPQFPTVVGGEGIREAYLKALTAIKEDPILSCRADEILQRKREEWFAREASRTLAG